MSDNSNDVTNPRARYFSDQDKKRLKELISEGTNVLREIDDLKEGLKDTVKDIGKELDIKPAQLNKAINVAHKSSLDDEKDRLTEIEDILRATGRF